MIALSKQSCEYDTVLIHNIVTVDNFKNHSCACPPKSKIRLVIVWLYNRNLKSKKKKRYVKNNIWSHFCTTEVDYFSIIFDQDIV